MSSHTQATPRELLGYLEVPLRRPWLVLAPVVLLTAGALAMALTLPRMYRTSTLILVESQKVPESVVRPGLNTNQQPRLLTIRQEILSRTRLERIIDELNPYPEIYGKVPLTDVIETMRGAVSIAVKGEDAFSIEYVHTNPAVAQGVANRLAGLFIDESTRSREEQVSGAADFLELQLEDARAQLEEKDQALRRFKEANLGRLPEQTNANLSTLQRLQLEQQSVSASLQSARQRLLMVEQGSDGPASPGPASGVEPASPRVELELRRAELEALRQRYTDEHPDVRSLQARVASLERRVALMRESRGDAPAPSYSSIATARQREAQLEVSDLQAKLDNVEQRIATFQRRVEESPRVEQELATLTRDYQQLNENYLTLLNKKLDAEMAERLEQRWKGEHFRVLDPAYLPEEPFSPNRRLILGAGLLLGLGLGIGLAFVAEFLDSSVKNLADLEVFAPLPVLAMIPSTGSARPLAALAERLAAGFRGTGSGPGPVLAPVAEEDGPTLVKGHRSRRAKGLPAFVDSSEVRPRPGAGAPVSLLAPGGPLTEEFRSLASRVRALDAERPLRCIAIASAVVGEGKSTVAVGLAAALARSAGRVLLIEADLRRPVLDRYLGLSPADGVSDWLRGGKEPVRVRRVVPPGLRLLSGGRSLDAYFEAAFTETSEVTRMRALLEAARSSYDYVVVDCPPLLPVADASILQEFVDGFLIVIRERYAPIDSALRALDRVEPKRLRGVVLNDHREVLPRYRKYQSEYYRKNA